MTPTSISPPQVAVTIAPDYGSLCDLAADGIAALIQTKPSAVLGLATGSTPLGVYERLVQRYGAGKLDFSQVTCFNLDEYYPMLPESPRSYSAFMHQHLFRHVNCRHWFVPNGRLGTPQQIAERCRDYEAKIKDAGGIDLQLLGIGRTGHIGFNEPGSAPNSRTRLVTLAPLTREDAAAGFGGLENVPLQAVSTGIGTILEAREIVVLASGPAKAEIVQSAFTGKETARIPASRLRTHPQVQLYLDKEAAAKINSFFLPIS